MIELKDQMKGFSELNEANKWKLDEDKKGFKIHTRVDPVSGVTMSRGEGLIPYPIEKVWELAISITRRQEFDEMFDKVLIQYFIFLRDIAWKYLTKT